METQLEKDYEFFINTDMENYIGEWVAICDDQVIAHGKNVKEVFGEARKKCPGKNPFLTKVPSKETLIF